MSIGSLVGATSQTFNSKTTSGPPLPRENLADRLKREFDVHVQEDEMEKNKAMPPPLSPIKIRKYTCNWRMKNLASKYASLTCRSFFLQTSKDRWN